MENMVQVYEGLLTTIVLIPNGRDVNKFESTGEKKLFYFDKHVLHTFVDEMVSTWFSLLGSNKCI